MKDGWIPIWADGRGWQLWRDDEYVATVSVGRWEHGIAYVPRRSRKAKRFKRGGFQAAAAFVKGLTLPVG